MTWAATSPWAATTPGPSCGQYWNGNTASSVPRRTFRWWWILSWTTPFACVPLSYVKKAEPKPIRVGLPQDLRIALVVSDRHAVHHVKERGYVESPARIQVIEKALLQTGLFEPTPIRHFAQRHITAVHDRAFVDYLSRLSRHIPPGKSVYPYVFPIRNGTRPPKELPMRAGYYCIDTFTPLSTASYEAALRAVDCAMTGAQHLLDGGAMAYALVRPPGHHAERRVFGGFCYLNSAAIAAHALSGLGRVAILDIDYHHGNGQQEIFYRRSDVLTLSLHGHPRFAYPYFSGFDTEKGEGAGLGYNVNLPPAGEPGRPNLPRRVGQGFGADSPLQAPLSCGCVGIGHGQGRPHWKLESESRGF